MRRSAVLPRILALDPERDCQRIVRLSAAVDFPWDTRRALELALLHSFAVPNSARLLAATGELTERTAHRFDDTVRIVSTLGLHGWEHPAGRAALRRMNELHRRHPIPNDEYLYVLSTFVLEPLRWNARWGWRPLSEAERRATFHFWREVGRRMAIRELPGTLEGLERYRHAFERERLAFDPANRALAVATRELVLRRALPGPLAPLRGLGRALVHAGLEPRLRQALGLPAPPAWAGRVLAGALQARAALLRRLPPRRRPVGPPRAPSRPPGTPLEALGPDPEGRR